PVAEAIGELIEGEVVDGRHEDEPTRMRLLPVASARHRERRERHQRQVEYGEAPPLGLERAELLHQLRRRLVTGLRDLRADSERTLERRLGQRPADRDRDDRRERSDREPEPERAAEEVAETPERLHV